MKKIFRKIKKWFKFKNKSPKYFSFGLGPAPLPVSEKQTLERLDNVLNLKSFMNIICCECKGHCFPQTCSVLPNKIFNRFGRVDEGKIDFNKGEQDFEEFLMDKHGEDYTGTDDMMPDAFNDWIQDLEIEDFINYGNEYVQKFRRKKIDEGKPKIICLCGSTRFTADMACISWAF